MYSNVLVTTFAEGEQHDDQEVLKSLNELRSQTGYGEVRVVMRAGVVDEIEIKFTRKPNFKRKREE